MLRASNILATGGTFVHHHQAPQNVDNRQFHYNAVKGGFELLQEHVAPAAFHNSGERFDPPKCHPNTRVAVLRKIVDWVKGLDTEALNALIMWLSGPAGAGKSAIAQSIAELCCAEGYLLASFFFARSDPSRNHGRSLFPSIAYQIYALLPATREQILTTIESDPLIFTRSLATQFMELIVKPLDGFVDSGSPFKPNFPRFILIDGLDECRDRQVQKAILDTISDALRNHRIPLIFLICSRPEYEISSTFSSAGMNEFLTRVVLDDSYLPNNDISLFLREKFDSVKESHPLKRLIPSTWPTDEVVESLVLKSSGQFTYASTVIKYVTSPRHRPTDRLDVVLNLRPAGRDLPFAELDALYMHIFASIEEIELVLQVLGLAMLDSPYCYLIEGVLSLAPGEVEILFCDLGSIIEIKTPEYKIQELHILHASLPDFLLDPQRSHKFSIDIDLKQNEYLQLCLRLLSESTPPSYPALVYIAFKIAKALPTPELQEALLKFSLEPIYAAFNTGIPTDGDPVWSFFHREFVPNFFRALKEMKFDAGEILYASKLKEFHQYLKDGLSKYHPDEHLTFVIACCDHPFRRRVLSIRPESVFLHILHLVPGQKDAEQIRFVINMLTSQPLYPNTAYLRLVTEFLEDPQLSGEWALDGTRYSNAALRCLKYLCDHLSQTLHRRYAASANCNLPWAWRQKKRNSKQKSRAKKEQQERTKSWDSPLTKKIIRSEAFYFALDRLPKLLSRSEKSEDLINFARQRCFAMLSCKFPRTTKRAKRAIADYLERVGSETTDPIIH